MKPWTWRLSILLLLTVSLSALPRPVAADDFPPGRIRFSPEVDLEQEINAFIRSAERHVLVFTEELALDSVVEALIERRGLRAIPVRLLLPVALADHERIRRLRDARVDVVTNGGSSGFTGTFIEIDGQRVLFTPHGLTYSLLHSERNYIYLIDHHQLGDDFQAEFYEMFTANQYGSSSPATIPYPQIQVPPCTLQPYFLPENDPSERISQLVDSAASQIHIQCERLASLALAGRLLGKYRAGIDVRIILGGRQSGDEAVFDLLRQAGIDIFEKPVSLDRAELRINAMQIDNRQTLLLPAKFFAGTASTNDAQALIVDCPETTALFARPAAEMWQLLQRSVALRGHLRDSRTDEPLRDARLTVLDSGNVSWSSQLAVIPDSGLETWTDRYGYYSFKDLGTGEVLLRAEKDGYFADERILPVNSTPRRTDIRLLPVSIAGALRGQVLEAGTHKAVEGAEIIAESVSANLSGAVTRVRGRSGPQGWFRLERIPAGSIRLRLLTPWHNPVSLTPPPVPADGLLELPEPVRLVPIYRVSVLPNPIFPETLFVTIQTPAGRNGIPLVTVAQKDYTAISVTMRYAASSSAEIKLFTGSYRLVPGYWGEAVVDVNGGQYQSRFQIGFLEAGSRYVFQSPERIALSLAARRGSGVITASTGTAWNLPPGEFAETEATVLRLDGEAGLELSADSRIGFPTRRARTLIYHRPAAGDWQALETEIDSSEVRATVRGFGEYGLLTDIRPPAVEFRDGSAWLRDAGSGIDTASIRLEGPDRPEPCQLLPLPDGWQLLPRAKSASGLVLQLADRAGNLRRLPWMITSAAAADDRASLQIFPNPVRGGIVSLRLIRTRPGPSRLRIRDAAGRLVHTDELAPAPLQTFIWNLTRSDGTMVANGSYFAELSDPGRGLRLASGKIAVLR